MPERAEEIMLVGYADDWHGGKKQAMRNKPLSIDPWQNYKNIFGFVERGHLSSCY